MLIFVRLMSLVDFVFGRAPNALTPLKACAAGWLLSPNENTDPSFAPARRLGRIDKFNLD